MKTFVRLLVIALASTTAALAQTESFDIATFVRPKGWQRTEAEGALVLQHGTSAAGRTELCQILLYPSQPSGDNPATNFQREWDQKVAPNWTNMAVRPPQTEKTPNGWTVVTGSADAAPNGTPRRVLLIVSTGFGRSFTILVALPPGACQPEFQQFFNSLNLNATSAPNPAPNPLQGPATSPSPANPPTNPSGNSGSLDAYLYTLPPQWTQAASHDRIVLSSPVYNNGERCQITMLPLRPSSQPLALDAVGAFRGLFRVDPLSVYPSPPPQLTHGLSPEGWEYFSIHKLVGGQEGEARTIGTILLVAKLGAQVATIVAVSKDFMVSQCFGLLSRDVWPAFFYTLNFKGAQPTQQGLNTIRQTLAGTWNTATSSVGLRYTFLANGRYQDAAATQHTSQNITTTTGFFGDGAWSLNGNTIVLNGDDHRRSMKFIRVEQLSRDSGQTWRDQLCLLDPGATGEVCYQKE